MLGTLSVTAPIFLLILLGYVAVRVGWLAYDGTATLSRYALSFALPALMFSTLAQRPLHEVIVPPFFIAYAAGSLLAFGIGLIVAALVRRTHPLDNAFFGMGVAMSNSGYIGYALIAQLFGESLLIAVAMSILTEVVLIMPLTLILAELHSSRGQNGLAHTLKLVLLRVVKNPILQSIVAGLLVAQLGWSLPAFVDRTISMLAGSAAAVALFAIGGTLVGQRLREGLGGALAIAAGKLIVHPAAVLALLVVVPAFDPTLTQAALILSALPMVTIFPLLAQRYGQEAICSSALVITTLLSFVTLNLWLWALGVGSAAPGLVGYW